jgi:hypothetical protein
VALPCSRTSSPEVRRPYGAPSSRSLLPGTARPAPPFSGTLFVVPRRGLPHPLRSAFAVFHDLDGLLLLGPCELSHPLTPMGFGSLLPARKRGMGLRSRDLPVWPVAASGIRRLAEAHRRRPVRSTRPSLRRLVGATKMTLPRRRCDSGLPRPSAVPRNRCHTHWISSCSSRQLPRPGQARSRRHVGPKTTVTHSVRPRFRDYFLCTSQPRSAR